MQKPQEKQQTINEVLDTLTPAQKETTEKLRQLIKNTVPQAVEMVKQGKIVYKLENKDFAWISNYQGHVDVELAMGSRLSSDLLKRRGVAEPNPHKRHIEADNYELIEPELTRLLCEAANLTLECAALE